MNQIVVRILISLVWIIPFGLITGYSLFDWQWWLMNFAVVAHTNLLDATKPKKWGYR